MVIFRIPRFVCSYSVILQETKVGFRLQAMAYTHNERR